MNDQIERNLRRAIFWSKVAIFCAALAVVINVLRLTGVIG